MNNLCVFGNSHTAALVEAWRSIEADFPELSLTFFAYPNKGLFDTDVHEESIIPTSHHIENAFEVTSAGKNSVKLSDYDGVLLYGLLDPNQFLFEIGECLSDQLQDRLRVDIINNELNFHLLKLIRQLDTMKMVHVGLAPYKAHRGEILDDIRALSAESISPVFEELKNEFNFSFVFQPKSTVVNGRYTIESYRFGHPNLDIGNERAYNKVMPDDLKHMNSDYGKVWLERYLAAYWKNCSHSY